MRKRTESVRETIIAEGPNGPIYLYRGKWNADKKSMTVEWTEDINKAKIWRYPLMAATWLKGRTITVLMTGAKVCSARQQKGWIEK